MSATMEISARPNDVDRSPEDTAPTVVLADRDEPTRLGLREALEHRGFSVLAEACDADQAIDAALLYRPDVCLLDMSMPGGGITAAAQIVPELPGTKIAILAAATGEGDLLEALHAGADGFLLKGTAPDRLSTALRAMLRGEAVLPRALTSRLVLEIRNAATRAPAPRRSRLRYLPRLAHHYNRRRRSGMSVLPALRSARLRMRDYR